MARRQCSPDQNFVCPLVEPPFCYFCEGAPRGCLKPIGASCFVQLLHCFLTARSCWRDENKHGGEGAAEQMGSCQLCTRVHCPLCDLRCAAAAVRPGESRTARSTTCCSYLDSFINSRPSIAGRGGGGGWVGSCAARQDSPRGDQCAHAV